MSTRGRHGTRRLLLQALYQSQLSGHDGAELQRQFSQAEEYADADGDYFTVLLADIMDNVGLLDEHIDALADRPIVQIDPIEHAILWVGMAELRSHAEVPIKVVINEAIELAKEFGAQDSYRYINAILDKASSELR